MTQKMTLCVLFRAPVAYISGGTEIGELAAPIMASFSSRGPNAITPDILKVNYIFLYCVF